MSIESALQSRNYLIGLLSEVISISRKPIRLTSHNICVTDLVNM